MPRTARLVVPGLPHHVTQRGTRRFDIFRDEADRLDYLKLLIESCHEFRLRILAYCLMTNHVHFIAVPASVDSIRRVFHRLHGTYSKRFNIKHGFVGHLWQERPFSCVLSESHFWNAIRYVEQNPVRASMVQSAEAYRWSSAAAHCQGRGDPLLDPHTTLTESIADWRAWLSSPNDTQTNRFIRECTFTGKPCGDEVFVKRMEEAAGRDFTRKKPGPKPKQTGQASLLLDWSEDRIIQ